MRVIASFFLAIVASSLLATSAFSAETSYNPNTQFYDMNGSGVLSLWGVPAANGNALVANPDYGWPTEASVASWLAMLIKAQEMGLVVMVGYDPNTLDIWYIARPR
jgi:hypothetical protein